MAQFYFAYGADMDPEDLGHRCDMRRRGRIRFSKSTPAKLPGYRLVCNIPSKPRGGGIFNIVEDANASVTGVLYALFPGDTLSVLVMKEGEAKDYALKQMPVVTLQGEQIQAAVLKADGRNKDLAPSSTYLDLVIRAASKHRLPAEWIQMLQELRSEAKVQKK